MPHGLGYFNSLKFSCTAMKNVGLIFDKSRIEMAVNMDVESSQNTAVLLFYLSQDSFQHRNVSRLKSYLFK